MTSIIKGYFFFVAFSFILQTSLALLKLYAVLIRFNANTDFFGARIVDKFLNFIQIFLFRFDGFIPIP